MNMWDEIENILAEDEANRPPLWIELTPNGKTLVAVYSGEYQEQIIEALIEKLGQPELAGPSEDFPENVLFLFPHQNLPPELKELAKDMAIQALSQDLME